MSYLPTPTLEAWLHYNHLTHQRIFRMRKEARIIMETNVVMWRTPHRQHKRLGWNAGHWGCETIELFAAPLLLHNIWAEGPIPVFYCFMITAHKKAICSIASILARHRINHMVPFSHSIHILLHCYLSSFFLKVTIESCSTNAPCRAIRYPPYHWGRQVFLASFLVSLPIPYSTSPGSWLLWK